MTLTTLAPETISRAARSDPIMSLMATLGGMHSTEITSPRDGFFVGGLNAHKALKRVTVDEYPSVGHINSHGVVDSPQQFIDKYWSLLDSDPRSLAVFFTPIIKSEQPSEGGWRWHKWGEYLGDKEPQHEYIYDEDDSIETVCVFHIVATEF